ncbi:MAG: hypothetical protein FWC22_04930 [Treponema sp.]|nr:hypothetical protein [Treponema sp.]
MNNEQPAVNQASGITKELKITTDEPAVANAESGMRNVERIADIDKPAAQSEALIANDVLNDTREHLARIEEQIADNDELLDETRNQIAELNDKIDVLTELIAQLMEQSRQLEPAQTLPPDQTQPPAQPSPSVPAQAQPAQSPPSIPAQTQTAQSPPSVPAQTQTAQPLPSVPVQTQAAQSPPSVPAQTQPAQVQPQPHMQIVQSSLPMEDTAGEETDSEEDPAVFRSVYVPELLPSPATRIESLTQMGASPQDNEINFSRIVRATVGQIIEIPFRGNGWVYLGELASRRGIVYNSRRNDSDGLSFIFTLEEPGTYALKFYRQDFIRDYILNDHVQVIAGDAPAVSTGWFNPQFDRGRVVAQPRWPSAFEEAQIRSGVRPDSEPVVSGTLPVQESTNEQSPSQSSASATAAAIAQTAPPSVSTGSPVPQTAAAQSSALSSGAPASSTTLEPQGIELNPQPESRYRIPGTEGLSGDAVIQRAQDAFNGGNTASAIALLDQYMSDFPGGSDEVYWMYGQFYEANTPARNILLSIEYYRRLLNEYPQSRRFSEARRRLAYLERFYVNIQ